MIKVTIFDGTDYPVEFISEATVHNFLDWSTNSKVVMLQEKDTNAFFTIPFLKYPLKIEDIQND